MRYPQPEILPIFPLSGAMLLPRGDLPLNIFEPRYLAMIEDALAGDKMVGMIQPRQTCMSCGTPEIHRIGCVGSISEYTETEDGRYLIVLTGLSRFEVAEELPPLRGYRRVRANWLRDPEDSPVQLDRARLLPALRKFLRARNLSCDLRAAGCCPDDKLLTSLAMICPFSPAEQQALLEAPDDATRAELLTCLLEMNADCAAGRH